MTGFNIKKVIAKSMIKGDASISFGRGLNIIQGRSDSGKTYAANCIDFIFGGSEKHPFKESVQYDGVSMIVAPNSSDGEITLNRHVGENKVEVISTVEGIHSGIYDASGRKGTKNPPLNELWLKLIGIEGDPMVVSNSRFETKRLTWRSLLRIFYLDESRIDDTDSIVEPRKKSFLENTFILSSLLYLITGKTFNQNDAQDKKEIKEARREAVTEYVNNKIKSTLQRKEQLESDLQLYEGVDVEKILSQAIGELEETQKRIDSAFSESERILSSILSAEGQMAECDLLLDRYNQLFDQLKGDIKRLSLIVEGEEAYEQVPVSTTCLYCEGEITPKKRTSYISASKIEMERLISQLNGLIETRKDVEDRKVEIQGELDNLSKQKDELEFKISIELRPHEESLNNLINNYRTYIRINSEIDIINAYDKDYNDDLKNMEDVNLSDKKAEYHPKEYFDEDFVNTMSDYAYDILSECNYAGLETAEFNLSTFDIEVNGENKGISHGKGYRSYLNTVMIMMLRKFLASHAKYDPHFFIIDTPLHGFDEGIDDKMPESMRAGLFRYFMNHQDEGQLIVIENLDHIPDLDYEANGVMVETFWKTEESGKRYGFLNDVK